MKQILCVLVSVFTVLNAHAQWTTTALPNGGTISENSIAETGTSLFVGSGLSVFRSTNNGASWSATGAVAAPGIRALMVVGSTVFCATLVDADRGGVFRSTNDGTSWSQVYNPPGGVNAPAVLALAVSTNSATLFAGTALGPAGTTVARSTNNGTNWTTATTGLPLAAINALQSSAGNIFAALGVNRGIYRSTNDGTNWALASSGVLGTSRRLYASGTNVYVISDSGMFVTTNGGTSWTAINTTGLGTVSALAISGQNMFAGSTTGGVFRSTNGGSAWTAVNTGLTELSVHTLGRIGGTHLLAGTATRVWRRPLSEVTTGVEEFPNETPNEFSLSQNYPNPFNPSTTIHFSVGTYGPASPAGRHTSLRVFNLLGQEVATLVNEELKAGSYAVAFDAKNLASGIYVYRLQAGDFSQTKKMLLLR